MTKKSTSKTSPRSLTVWDFEALHDTVMELEYGANWFRRFKPDAQPPVVDIKAVVQTVENRSRENWHDAVADWRFFPAYAPALDAHNVRSVHVFNRSGGRGKRLGAYEETWLERTPMVEYIEEVVLVGVTDRLVDMVKKAKANGLQVTGINVPSKETRTVETLCDDFIEYTELLKSGPGNEVHRAALDTHRHTLQLAVQGLIDRTGRRWIEQVRIKPAMVALNPDFDEKELGYPTFSAFLHDQGDLLQARRDDKDRESEFSIPDDHRTAPLPAEEQDERRIQSLVALYCRISAQQGLRLPDPEVMWVGVDIYSAFINDPVGFASFKELDEECLLQLRQDLPGASITDAKKVRQVLFKCYLFSPGTDEKIGFREDIKTLEDVERLYFDLILLRIARHAPQPVNYRALSLAATGDVGSAERLSRQHQTLEVS